MKVNLSDRAVANLQEIFEYIAVDSEYFAKRTVNQILHTIKQIGQFPYSGRESTEYGDPKIRERFSSNYRIGYKILANSVEIATVRHVSRLPEE